MFLVHRMDNKQAFLYAGLTIVVGTHVYMLMKVMPEGQQKAHAIINLAGAGLIVYGAF
jgi:hypothetical protein